MKIKRKSVEKALEALSGAFWAVDENNQFMIPSGKQSRKLSRSMNDLRLALGLEEAA